MTGHGQQTRHTINNALYGNASWVTYVNKVGFHPPLLSAAISAALCYVAVDHVTAKALGYITALDAVSNQQN